jgi:hypothetical protein
MVAATSKDVAAIYNHVWKQPRQTGMIAGLRLTAHHANNFKLERLLGEHLSEGVMWSLEFHLVHSRWLAPQHIQLSTDTLICDYHPQVHAGGWGAVDFKDHVRAGIFQIKKVSGDLGQFQKDWVLLLLFQHEFTE